MDPTYPRQSLKSEKLGAHNYPSEGRRAKYTAPVIPGTSAATMAAHVDET